MCVYNIIHYISVSIVVKPHTYTFYSPIELGQSTQTLFIQQTGGGVQSTGVSVGTFFCVLI